MLSWQKHTRTASEFVKFRMFSINPGRLEYLTCLFVIAFSVHLSSNPPYKIDPEYLAMLLENENNLFIVIKWGLGVIDWKKHSDSAAAVMESRLLVHVPLFVSSAMYIAPP